MKRHTFFFTTMLVLALAQAAAVAQTRDEKVRADRNEVSDDGLWIYNDLPLGYAQAQQSGKPLLIVFR